MISKKTSLQERVLEHFGKSEYFADFSSGNILSEYL